MLLLSRQLSKAWSSDIFAHLTPKMKVRTVKKFSDWLHGIRRL